MRFFYQCTSCQGYRSEDRLHALRNDPIDCPECKAPMQRLFTAPFLTTQPVRYKEENKFALGFSETERKETRKQDDIAYAKSWGISPKSL